MKKAIVLILALVLALCICACGKKDDGIDRKAIKTEFDKAVSYTETLVDTKDMTSTVQDESDGVYLFKQWNHTGDFVNTDIDLDFELNGKTITLGTTTVGDLKAMGFDVECGFETLKPGDTASLSVYIDGKRCVFDTATNDSDSEKSIDEMPLNAFINDDLLCTYKGLSSSSTLKDVVDVLGSPNYAASLATNDKNETVIALGYVNNTTQEDGKATTSLEITLQYDPDTDSALLSGIEFDHSVESAEEQK